MNALNTAPTEVNWYPMIVYLANSKPLRIIASSFYPACQVLHKFLIGGIKLGSGWQGVWEMLFPVQGEGCWGSKATSNTSWFIRDFRRRRKGGRDSRQASVMTEGQCRAQAWGQAHRSWGCFCHRRGWKPDGDKVVGPLSTTGRVWWRHYTRKPCG